MVKFPQFLFQDSPKIDKASIDKASIDTEIQRYIDTEIH